jgi:hypothetical protein
MRTGKIAILAVLVLIAVAAVAPRIVTATQPAAQQAAPAPVVSRYQVVTDKNIQPAYLLDTTTGQVWERAGGAGNSTWKEFVAPLKQGNPPPK